MLSYQEWTRTHFYFIRPMPPSQSRLLPVPRPSCRLRVRWTACSTLTKVCPLFILIKDIPNSLFSDIPANLIGDLDRDIIKRAREVITNATMAKIMGEEPHGPTAFRDTVCQQILALCTRLRISLVIIDKLMALANSITAKITK